MSVAIVGIIGVSKGYGGFETLAENLIGDGSPITTVYCASKYFDQKIERYKGTSLYYLPFDSKGFQKVFHTGVSMIHAGYSGHKVILALGVSAGLLMPIVRLVYPRMKLITNIDGLEWQRGKWNYVIRKVLKLSEILSVKYSNVVIADNEILVEYVSNTYQVNAPMIPYGGDHAYFPLETLNDEKGAESALSICRIVPENNVHVILETFAGNGNPITFIGNWDSSKYGRQLRKKFGHKQNIEMLDPIFDLHELALYRSKC
ncbi:MAG: DUF1972 domain-containing protein, partial [Ekhidna sp.]